MNILEVLIWQPSWGPEWKSSNTPIKGNENLYFMVKTDDEFAMPSDLVVTMAGRSARGVNAGGHRYISTRPLEPQLNMNPLSSGVYPAVITLGTERKTVNITVSKAGISMWIWIGIAAVLALVLKRRKK